MGTSAPPAGPRIKFTDAPQGRRCEEERETRHNLNLDPFPGAEAR